MSLLNALHIGASGLRVASTGTNAVSHNVSNATTPGFSKRTVRVQTADPVERYGHGFGQGAKTSEIRRTADDIVNKRAAVSTGRQADASARFTSLSAIEDSFDATSGASLSNLLDNFYDDLNSLSQAPGDRTRRQELLVSADRLTEGFNEAADALLASTDAIDEELTQSMAEVQRKLDQVADFNGRIASATTGNGRADFQDQRDQLIYELAESIGVTAQFSADGQATLLVGGHAVVTGPTARTVTFTQTATGAPKVELSTNSGVVDITTQVGGRAGGLLTASTNASSYLADLNAWVDSFATSVNAQHALGFDAAGAPGADVFTFTVGAEASTFAVDATLLADPDLFAAAGAATAATGDGDNLALIIDLEGQLLHTGATRTAADALADIYARVGRDVATASLEADRYGVELSDISALRESISGVDLDQEASDLMAWQASYEAAARVITTTNDLLGVLMGMGT